MGLKDFFAGKDKNSGVLPTVKEGKIVNEVSNWYSDRYSTVILQRNILLILLVVTLFIIIFSVYRVSMIATQHKIKPFVIEVEERTGLTDIVNPVQSKQLAADQALTQYFIMKYISTRESYCDFDYKYNYLTVVRLLSDQRVYSEFLRFINTDPQSPITVYGKAVCTGVKLRSIQLFSNPDKNGKIRLTSFVRYTVQNTSGSMEINKHKVASLEYAYRQMELSTEDRLVNPLGFQVLQYQADEELFGN